MLEISARIVAVIRWNPPRPRIPASMKSRVGRAVWRAKGLWPHWFESDGRSPGKAGLIVGSNDLACPTIRSPLMRVGRWAKVRDGVYQPSGTANFRAGLVAGGFLP